MRKPILLGKELENIGEQVKMKESLEGENLGLGSEEEWNHLTTVSVINNLHYQRK